MSPATKSIRDQYEIIHEIGAGGMATVYKAVQTSLGRIVAIKEIKPAVAASDELVERFKREARTAASLVHENIIQVYNFGEQKGSLFIVLEYVDGQDLKTLLLRTGALPPRVAAIIMRDVARALAFAHGKGLVHRDVKPGNVMVSTGGEIKLMDFGIVREMDSDLTSTGAFLGTPSYMSPEQFLGEKITFSSDIFSMGVMLYELLSGAKPFRADSDSSLSKKVREEKPPPLRSQNPAIPRKLRKITARCMKKDPQKRYPDAEALVRELDRFVSSRSREQDRKEVAAWIEAVMEMDRTAAVAPTQKQVPEKEVKAAPKKKKSKDLELPDEKTAPAPEEEAADLGASLARWAWRLMLLAIAVMAAVVVFLLVNPFPVEDAAGEQSRISKAVEWVHNKVIGPEKGASEQD